MRRSYIARLEKVMRDCDRIVGDPSPGRESL